MPFIDEIFVMDEIFSLEKKAEQKYGIPIQNVSYWDSSTTFQKYIKQVLVLPPPSLPWNYYYTYSISQEDRQQVLLNLGVMPQIIPSTMGLLLQSGTIAIVNMINLLVQYKYQKLCILQPSYFSVAICCSIFTLEYGKEQILFTDGKPKIPVDKIIAGCYDCIWITSPIFCTGYYFDEDCMNDIKYLKSIGLTLIFDESLALPGKEMVRFLPIDKKTFSIYSPHKAISINGLKFSVIVCDKLYEDFLEQWVDIFAGALGASNRDAVFHFISTNYLNACYPAYKTYIEYTFEIVNNIVNKFSFAFMLPNTIGHYVNIFIKYKQKKEERIVDILDNIIDTELVSFIPSELNGFDPSQGLSFRINLTGNPLDLKNNISRIMRYFDKHISENEL